ncbi:hypothetical protein TWF506_008690 [Arthrobotrys conoides]|uniref:HNH nuclease domain-containing protein n=1 Tax=Arthrobotrys conoides TaxID=74498 RepID=A0AAN8RSD0_9PEZI
MQSVDDDPTPRPRRQRDILDMAPPPSGPNFTSAPSSQPNLLSNVAEDGISTLQFEIYQPPAIQETNSDTSSQKRHRSHAGSETSARSKRRKRRQPLETDLAAAASDDIKSQSSSHSCKTTSSRGSAASDKSKFSDRTKWDVEQLSEEGCWICGNQRTSLDVCHVIARKDSGFHDLSSRGIVPFSHRGDKANAIPLCKRCHDGFDSSRPQVIILPVDLQYFLDVEEHDFRERSENAQGTIRRRLSPSGDQYRAHLLNSRPKCVEDKYLNDLEDSDLPGGLYQAYLREDILGTRRHPIPLGKYDEPRIWHGSPTAIIVHALQALACVDDTKWISEEILDTLHAIARAWRKEPFPGDDGLIPQAVDQTVAPHTEASESASTRSHLSEQESGSESEARTRGDASQEDDASSATDYDEGLDASNWKWGPLFTANQALQIFCRRS